MALLLSDVDYTRFRSLIMRRTGLDFPPPRRHDLESGLRHALGQLRDAARHNPRPARHSPPPTTLDALYKALAANDPLAWDEIVDALTVCETYFFRNASQFEALRKHVLPELIAERRRQGNLSLRLWSAGCASGEEAYSLAILVRELLPDWQNWQLDILGTDINNRALEQAAHAAYRDWSFREAYALPWRDLYFVRFDTQYHLREDIRTMVRFAWCNLIDDCGTDPFVTRFVDVILCRNVILYFGAHFRRWVYQRLYQALAPGGWLVVGHADPSPPSFATFEARPFPGATFYQRPYPGVLPPRPGTAPLPAHHGADPPPDQPSLPPHSLPEAEEASAELHYRQGRWHADRQHWDEALFHCQQAVALDPTYTQAHYTLALIYQSLGQCEQAIEALRHTIYLARNWVLPRFTLAALYRQVGQTAQARRELRNVIALTAAMPPEATIPGGDGLTAARLRAAAERQLADLGGRGTDNNASPG